MPQPFHHRATRTWPSVLGAVLVVASLATTARAAQVGGGEQQTAEPGSGGTTPAGTNIAIVPPGYTVILSGGSVILVPTYVGYWWWSPTPIVTYGAFPYVAHPGFWWFHSSFTWVHVTAPVAPFWLGAWPILGYGHAQGVLPGTTPLAVSRRDLYAPPPTRSYWSEWITQQLRKRPPPFDKPWGRW